MINSKSVRVVCRLVNRWYTAVGYWQWHQQTVLTRYATVLNRVLPVLTQVASGQCVEVELFARYPLKKVTEERVRRQSNQACSMGAIV